MSRISKVELVLLGFLATLVISTIAGKPLQENVDPHSGSSGPSGSNLLIRLAKSLANEAFSDFKETARRDPKLGFNFTFPSILPPVINATNPFTYTYNQSNERLAITTLVTLLFSIKTIIVRAVLAILAIIFLISGTAFFVCNSGILSCSQGGGGIGGNLQNGAGNLFSSFSSRNGMNSEKVDRLTHPVYKAVDDGYRKYQ